MRKSDYIARFWAKVDTSGECWEWTANKIRGYGQFTAAKRKYRAHRFAYELLVGPIPEGLEIDHLCRNRACVNPAHLEPVTRQENLRRAGVSWRYANAARRAKTHCKRGHLFDEKNTYITRSGGRQCRQCCAIRERGRRESK